MAVCAFESLFAVGFTERDLRIATPDPAPTTLACRHQSLLLKRHLVRIWRRWL